MKSSVLIGLALTPFDALLGLEDVEKRVGIIHRRVWDFYGHTRLQYREYCTPNADKGVALRFAFDQVGDRCLSSDDHVFSSSVWKNFRLVWKEKNISVGLHRFYVWIFALRFC